MNLMVLTQTVGCAIADGIFFFFFSKSALPEGHRWQSPRTDGTRGLLIKPQSLEVCVAVAPDLTFGQLLWSPSVTVELLLHWLHVR